MKLSINLERSFTPYTSWTEKMEFDSILINGDILLLNSLHESIFCKSGSLKKCSAAYWFFKVSLSLWSSVVAPLTVTGKIFVGFQVGWRKAVYYFFKKNNFWYHLLTESDSRPGSAYILFLLVPLGTQSLGVHLPKLFPRKMLVHSKQLDFVVNVSSPALTSTVYHLYHMFVT